MTVAEILFGCQPHVVTAFSGFMPFQVHGKTPLEILLQAIQKGIRPHGPGTQNTFDPIFALADDDENTT